MSHPFTNDSISINSEFYNHLNDVNYGVKNPQFHVLSTFFTELIEYSEIKPL